MVACRYSCLKSHVGVVNTFAWTKSFSCCNETDLPCRCAEVPFAQWKHLAAAVLIKPETELGGEEGDKDRKEAKPAIRPRELLLCKLKWEERE